MTDYNLRLAFPSDLTKVHGLMLSVHRTMPNKDLYVVDSLHHIIDTVVNRGFGVVATFNHKIVGTLIVRFPMFQSDNLGRDIGISETRLPMVVHMESSAVLLEHRGNNLQCKMLQFAEELIDTNKFKYLLCTASPMNIHSCRNLEKLGYTVKLEKEMYGGHLRRIYYKEI